jgi:hypothetical protein
MGMEASRATTSEEFIRELRTAPTIEGPCLVEAVL